MRTIRLGSRLKDKVGRRTPRGFTILESMVAIGILAVGVLGALNGLIFSSTLVRDGQLRQWKMVLLDAKTQRLWLANKASLFSSAVALPTTNPRSIAIGTPPWTVDSSASVASDLGTGAYFSVTATGQITPVTTVTAGTPCGASSIPTGTYCREVLVTTGLPTALGPNAAILPSEAQAVTVWTRLSRKGEPASLAVVHQEVLVQ